MHYFYLNDTVEFKYNGKTFNGIILYSGEDDIYFPQEEGYGPNENVLNVMIQADQNKINDLLNAKIEISLDGSFTPEADEEERTQWEFFLELISQGLVAIGDMIQGLLDASATRDELVYTRSQLESDQALNEQIQVSDPGENPSNYKVITFQKYSRSRQGNVEEIYTQDTKIPAISVDPYWLVIGNHDIFNVNFFDNESEHANALRDIIGEIVKTCSHAMMYIATGLLVTILIWRSILLVKSSFQQNPEKAAQTRKVLDSWIKGVIVIGLIYIIAAMIVYFYSYIVDFLIEGINKNYTVRINLEGGYSFNTNSIGFMRFLSLTSNIYSKVGYSFLYVVGAVLNLILWVGMLMRMVVIAGLTIIAPITAVNMAKSTKVDGVATNGFTSFRGWITMYAICTFAPIIIILCQKLLLEVL